MTKQDTRTKILDTAERLIAENGIGNVSLRQIVKGADVNLAAVNYHFGSKQSLVVAVFKRHIDPINEERLQRLDALEKDAGAQPISLESIIEAFLLPALQFKQLHNSKDDLIIRLFGRIHTEPGELRKIILEQFTEIFQRFAAAFQKALPHLSRPEIAWRIRFMLGIMFSMMATPPEFEKYTNSQNTDPEYLVRHIISYVAAGFRSPAVYPPLEGENQ